MIPQFVDTIARGSWRIAEDVARAYLGQLARGERLARALLRHKRELLQLPGATGGAGSAPVVPGEAMRQLLARSLEQSGAASRDELFLRLVQALTPDEARILAALSEGSGAAIVHVETRSRKRSLESASVLGRTAGLALPDMSSAYVQNLTRLDLVELAPESPALELEYEIVLATRTIREALNSGVGPLPARAVRQTLRLSPLGRELWDACRASTRL
jgi:hypothetical protein